LDATDDNYDNDYNPDQCRQEVNGIIEIRDEFIVLKALIDLIGRGRLSGITLVAKRLAFSRVTLVHRAAGAVYRLLNRVAYVDFFLSATV